MARTKAAAPVKRQPSDVMTDHLQNGNGHVVDSLRAERKNVVPEVPSDSAGLATLVMCVGGIYGSLYAHNRKDIRQELC